MTGSIKNNIIQDFKRNFTYYGICLCAFFIGAAVALFIVFSMSELDNRELILYLGDFFESSGATDINLFNIFILSVKNNLTDLALISVLAFLVIGAPFICGFCAVKGFMSTFTVLFMFKAYGIKAALFCFLGIFPHSIISAPCYLFITAAALSFSRSLISDKSPIMPRMTRFMTAVLAIFLCLVMSALLRAYVEPVFIRLISGYFV